MPASVYDELLNWSAGLRPWQRDALRRLVRSSELSPTELDEVARIAYASAFEAGNIRLVPEIVNEGLEGDESAEVPVESTPTLGFAPMRPDPLTATHVPTRATGAPPIRLNELRHLSGVNRLRADEAISFTDCGLNLVFGLNGVGKSGYTRILKQACHTRAPESILADVYVETPQPPRASITYLEGDNERTHTWDLDKDSTDTNLPRIAVYDQRSAAVHVQRSGALVELLPPGLDVLVNLAATYGEVATWARQEHARLAAMPSPAIFLTATTPAVRTVLDQLGRAGAIEALEAVTTLSADEQAERGRLPGDIAALESGSVRSRTAAAILRESTCRNQAARLTAAGAQFAASQVDALEQAISDHKAAIAQADALPSLAAEALEGVHGEHWQAMWDAAMAYAREDAYPGQPYPSESTPLCVLCHQPLDAEAVERLTRLAHDAVESAAAQVRRHERTYRDLVTAMAESISTRAIDETLLDTMPAEKHALVTMATAEVMETRSVLLLRQAPAPITPFTSDEMAALRALSDELTVLEVIVDAEAGQAATLIATLAGQSDDPALVTAKRQRLAALTERNESAKAKNALRRLHNAKARQSALDMVVRQCATDSVSRKSTALSSSYVDSICAAFAEETELLSGGDVKMKMTPLSTQRGARRTGIVLTDAKNTSVGVEEVLSEGERRIASLAAFFADVRVAEDDSAIILDDPMTSLDHKYQEAVAKRLIQEARTRQVLVFTHSSSFVTALFTAQDEDRDDQLLDGIDPPRPVPIETIEITKDRASGSTGLRVESFLAPLSRIDRIQTQLCRLIARARRLWDAGEVEQYERAVEGIATHLRRAWECGIEDILLNRVVTRNSPAIKTEGRLYELVGITPAEVAAVHRGMDQGSFFVHPTPDDGQRDSPAPDELQSKVSEFNAWVDMVRARKAEKRRLYTAPAVRR